MYSHLACPPVREKLDRITVAPNICLGQLTIRKMRITVGSVLKLLAKGIMLH
ncbi:DUF433 domain-containing protein [Microcystis sp. LEGE 08355]|nr:DUF433 domain-containing protein [Microcystis sp. LEGE 08355]